MALMAIPLLHFEMKYKINLIGPFELKGGPLGIPKVDSLEDEGV